MFKKFIFVIVLFALALAACSPAAAPQSAVKEAPPMYYDGATGGEASSSVGNRPAPVSADASRPGAADRMVIRNVNLALVVKDPEQAAARIGALAEELGGFVVASNLYQASTDAAGNKIMQASVSVRIPAAQLTGALEQFKALAVTVSTENVTGEDVTAAYTDMESRLRNLEAAEAQLQKIMDGASKTEDVLAVYNQLVSIRDQIEQVKGQMKYYSEAAAMSLVSIDLQPDALSQPIEIGGWKPEGVARDAIEALVKLFQGLASAAIWLGIFCLPPALLFGVPVYFAARWAWRRWKK